MDEGCCDAAFDDVSPKSGLMAPIGRDFEKSNIALDFSAWCSGAWVGESSTMLEFDEDCEIVWESGCG